MEITKNQLDLFKVSEIEISYLPKFKISDAPKINSSQQSYSILLYNWDMNKIDYVEQFNILLLNRANKVLGIKNISTGGVSGTVADPKTIFQAALKANASSIILSHNHPSGNLNPSQQDIILTKKLKSAGEFLDLPVLDHIIITREGYYSFADQGLL